MAINFLERDPFKKVERYMNEIYGKKFNDEFKIIDGELAGIFKGHSTFVLKSKNYPDFYTRVSQYGKEYWTNYMQCLYYNQYRDCMQKVIEEVIKPCKVVYMVDFYPSHYPINYTFEDFLHDGDALKKIRIIVPTLSIGTKNAINSIISLLKEKQIPIGQISFTQIPNFLDAMKINDLNSWVDYEEANHKNIDTLIFIIRDFKIDRILEGLK